MILDDKMDFMKTASLVFSQKTKQLDGLMKLPISITSMLVHVHGDVSYAHHGFDIFVHDSNYTVGSFAKLLQGLERFPKLSSRCLFNGSRSSSLFEVELSRVEMCEAALPQLLGTPSKASHPKCPNGYCCRGYQNRFVFYS